MKRPNKGMAANGGGRPAADHGGDAATRKCGLNLMKLTGMILVLVMGSSVLFSVSVVLRDPPSDGLWPVAEARNLDFNLQRAILQENDQAPPAEVPNDKLLSDLLPTGFGEKSCLSRYESLLYRRGLHKKPSPYLISKLRSYEARHKRCGPYTNAYNKTVEDLKSGRHSSTMQECNYIVWISFSGLGNRILTLASAFLYALLTDRVLLVDRGIDVQDLFCEPFPEASWLLPTDFPLVDSFSSFDQNSHQSYGNLVKRNSTELVPQPYIYLHIVHDYGHHDKLFFCDQDQENLKRTPWLVMKTDNYFVPSLFLMPSFEQELHSLFPDKDTIFHLLGRYLFHPTNHVWGLISRYYEAYLSKADITAGIQIRVFDDSPGPFKHILDQILSCTTRENILPEISNEEGDVGPSSKQKKKKKTVAVLMTSLTSGYFEQVRDLYWESPTSTGEVIAVFQPSHEGHQQSEKQDHNRKAWAEMYLLSLTDKLVTSSWSTFGYVAQGLGGLKPWILYKPENQTAPDPPCRRAMSMEPCFHAPPFYNCKTRLGVDTGKIVPHVRHCEDMSWGLKLVQQQK